MQQCDLQPPPPPFFFLNDRISCETPGGSENWYVCTRISKLESDYSGELMVRFRCSEFRFALKQVVRVQNSSGW